MTTVEVELFGILHEAAGKRAVSLKLGSSASVKDLVHELVDSMPSQFKRALIDPELNDPRPNVLLLVNGKEIGVLDGLSTRVEDGDKVVLIPVSHGG